MEKDVSIPTEEQHAIDIKEWLAFETCAVRHKHTRDNMSCRGNHV
jgi:hypothetical protein